MSDSDMQSAIKSFFNSSRFAVAGASSDPTKYGHKVFAWYLSHSLPVTPLNPSRPSVTISSTDYPTLASPSSLPSAEETSLSVITPPAVTRKLLREAKEAGVKAVWLQPGSFDQEGLDEARKLWPGAAVGGGGACVLVHGGEGLRAAGRDGQGQGRL